MLPEELPERFTMNPTENPIARNILILLVRTAGLEPARGCPQGILSFFQAVFPSLYTNK
jgi:hypothetical protein